MGEAVLVRELVGVGVSVKVNEGVELGVKVEVRVLVKLGVIEPVGVGERTGQEPQPTASIPSRFVFN